MADTRFDYDRQAWVVHGRYIACSHPPTMQCGCYGRAHAGELAPAEPIEETIASHEELARRWVSYNSASGRASAKQTARVRAHCTAGELARMLSERGVSINADGGR